MSADANTQAPRLRFAPSPTGQLHIGGARTALFNWAMARRTGGKFVLRVEDTDAERSTREYEDAILDGLRWLGIDWDEGPEIGGPYAPYRQSERAERHREAAAALLESGHAYPCFCTPERLTALREQQQAAKQTAAYDGTCRSIPSAEARERMSGETHVVRFKVPEGETRFRDHVRGDVTFQNREVDDWIMVRSDGRPTYNFVVVIDDADMRITHVLRGEEHLVNTPKQVLLYAALGLPAPEFGHLPLMLGTDGRKLSKRTGDTALVDYRDKGYPREAVINFLSLQGWALDGATEVFSVDQLVENFEISDVSKGGSVFDMDKFDWLAGEYVRSDSVEHLARMCAPFVVAAGLADEATLTERADWFRTVVAAEQERIQKYSDLPARIGYLFAADDAVPFDEKAEVKARKQADGPATLRSFATWLDEQLGAGASTEALRDGAKAWVAERGLKFPALFQPLRLALTGLGGGPDLFDVIGLLGPERSLARIEHGARRLDDGAQSPAQG